MSGTDEPILYDPVVFSDRRQKRLAEWKAALAQGASQGDESIRLSGEEIENLKSLGYLH